LHPADEQRIIRAIEFIMASHAPFSQQIDAQGGGIWRGEDRFPAVKIGLRRQRAALAARIEERVKEFFRAGLIEEVRGLLAKGVPPQAHAFKGIGYREAREVVFGRMDRPEAVRRTIIATRRYAKRQMTWFRREPGVHWIEAGDDLMETVRRAADVIRSHESGQGREDAGRTGTEHTE
ncbi:MAG: tRNA (adenosine(37)-N6)-dimethylallyltransferase MiaA, partial [Acidobacteriota bacterium]